MAKAWLIVNALVFLPVAEVSGLRSIHYLQLFISQYNSSVLLAAEAGDLRHIHYLQLFISQYISSVLLAAEARDLRHG